MKPAQSIVTAPPGQECQGDEAEHASPKCKRCYGRGTERVLYGTAHNKATGEVAREDYYIRPCGCVAKGRRATEARAKQALEEARKDYVIGG